MSLCCLALASSVTNSKILQLQSKKNIVGVLYFALLLITPCLTHCLITAPMNVEI